MLISRGVDKDVIHRYNGRLKVKVAQLCPTLCDPMVYTRHGILQARILEWVAFPFFRGSSQPKDQTQVSCITRGFFTSWATREAQEYWSRKSIPFPGDLPNLGIKPGSPALQADSELWKLILNFQRLPFRRYFQSYLPFCTHTNFITFMNFLCSYIKPALYFLFSRIESNVYVM